MKTQFDSIVNVSAIGQFGISDLNPIIAMAAQENLSPAIMDGKRTLLLLIDPQKDFTNPDGALSVPGAVGDVERICRFIYRKGEEITTIMASLDTHKVFQIFHPAWWTNANGENPAPYTLITSEDIAKGIWRPAFGNPRLSIDYVNELEKGGKKVLCIWPYHCLIGSEGFGIENELFKMITFHSTARKTVFKTVEKGKDPYSEMYGIIRPEYSKANILNTAVLNEIENYDVIYVAGEAASHCLMESVAQIIEYFKNRPEILQKIVILRDCTSPIPSYEAATEAAFKQFEAYGIKFMDSTAA